jgi:hypothetical protein
MEDGEVGGGGVACGVCSCHTAVHTDCCLVQRVWQQCSGSSNCKQPPAAPGGARGHAQLEALQVRSRPLPYTWVCWTQCLAATIFLPCQPDEHDTTVQLLLYGSWCMPASAAQALPATAAWFLCMMGHRPRCVTHARRYRALIGPAGTMAGACTAHDVCWHRLKYMRRHMCPQGLPAPVQEHAQSHTHL